MTCVIGFVDKKSKKMTLSADSMVSSDDVVDVRSKIRKIYKINDCIFGFSGDIRFCSYVIKHLFRIYCVDNDFMSKSRNMMDSATEYGLSSVCVPTDLDTVKRILETVYKNFVDKQTQQNKSESNRGRCVFCHSKPVLKSPAVKNKKVGTEPTIKPKNKITGKKDDITIDFDDTLNFNYNPEFQFMFMINGNIWTIDNSLIMFLADGNYYAIGSGGVLAMASVDGFIANSPVIDEKPEEMYINSILENSINIAAKYVKTVGKSIITLSVDY